MKVGQYENGLPATKQRGAGKGNSRMSALLYLLVLSSIASQVSFLGLLLSLGLVGLCPGGTAGLHRFYYNLFFFSLVQCYLLSY